MRSTILLIALFFGTNLPLIADAQESSSTRASIEAAMAAHPNDAELQEKGRIALDALTDWEAAAARLADRESTSADSPSAKTRPGVVVGPPAFPNPMEGMDSWDINENWLGASVAYEEWTVNDDFPGIKGLINGRYSLYRSKKETLVSDCDCNPPPPAPYMQLGVLGGTAQFGDEGLERAFLGATAYSLQRNFDPFTRAWKPLRDTLQLGEVLHGKDDPLGLNSFTEITLARAGRTWGWTPNEKPFILMAGLGLSGGWSWAESIQPEYNDVSNPFIGTWITLGAARPKWGKVYLEMRTINGFQFSSPSAGGSTSREARFRFGMIKRFDSCLSLEVYWDKRSFNFSDHRLPDLYTKVKRTGLQLGCSW